MILLTILLLVWDLVDGTSQPQPQQVLPPRPFNPYLVPGQYGAYLQQLDAAGAQALPVQHSFTVNHSPYTFIPQPQIFYPPPPPPPLRQQNEHILHQQQPERRQRPAHVQQLNNRQPIQFLAKTPQYSPQQIQQFKPNRGDIQVVHPPNLVPQGRPPVQPYVTQSDKFRQQTGKYQQKPIEDKRYPQHQLQPKPRPLPLPILQPIQPPPPQPTKQPQQRRKQEEEEEEEEEEDSEEEDEEEAESEDESGSEEEEEEEEDEKQEASDLPPEHNRHEYDFDNRNYGPTFDAAKYIFNSKEQKKPGTKYYEEEVPRYHEEKGFGYSYHKNTKSKPKKQQQHKKQQEEGSEVHPARSKFGFYDSEPRFNHYEPNFEPYEPLRENDQVEDHSHPKIESYQPKTKYIKVNPVQNYSNPKVQTYKTPRRIKAKRIEIKNGKPTYYYYNSADPKPSNIDDAKNKDATAEGTRKRLVREKWFVLTKET